MRYVTSIPAAFLTALLSAGGAGAEDATITIESRTVRADDLSFEVRLDSGVPISGTLNDIVFDPAGLIGVRDNGRPQCIANSSIEKGATQFAFRPNGCTPGESCTSMRALVLSIDNVSPIPSGSVLYTCGLADDTPAGRYALHCANPVASNPDGVEVPATCVDGEIEVTASTVLLASTDIVHPGDTSLVEVRLFSTEAAVGVTTDLSIATLAIRGVSAPACVAAGDDVDATFSYRPGGCTPGADCTGVHAVVASHTGAPFASGSTLFTCGVDVPVTTPSGEYVVDLHDAAGTTAGGGAATVSVRDGVVRVDGPPRTPTVPGETPTPEHSALEIGSASGAPGSVVQIAVTLRTDEIIGGVQNDLHFEQQAPIAALPGGVPDCTPDPTVDWIDGPEFFFEPPLCVPGIDCTSIRALILRAETGTAIPDGTVIYTCNVAIDPGAVGHAALTCDHTEGSTPDGHRLAVSCTDGRIDIVAPTPMPTATSLPATPTLPSGSDVDSASSGGGCAIAPAAPGEWWMLAPLLLVWLRRRRL